MGRRHGHRLDDPAERRSGDAAVVGGPVPCLDEPADGARPDPDEQPDRRAAGVCPRSACRRSSCTAPEDRDARSTRLATSPSTFPARGSSSCPGDDHIPFVVDADGRARRSRSSSPARAHAPEPDRVLTTVMFTDIVALDGARGRARRQPLAALLDAHHASWCGAELERFRGREIDDRGRRLPRHVRRAGARDPLRRVGPRRRARARARAARGRPHRRVSSCMGDDIGGIAVHIGARDRGARRARRGARLDAPCKRPRRRLGPRVRRSRRARAQGRARASGASSPSRNNRRAPRVFPVTADIGQTWSRTPMGGRMSITEETLSAEAIDGLAATVRGRVVRPGDDDYDDGARRLERPDRPAARRHRPVQRRRRRRRRRELRARAGPRRSRSAAARTTSPATP